MFQVLQPPKNVLGLIYGFVQKFSSCICNNSLWTTFRLTLIKLTWNIQWVIAKQKWRDLCHMQAVVWNLAVLAMETGWKSSWCLFNIEGAKTLSSNDYQQQKALYNSKVIQKHLSLSIWLFFYFRAIVKVRDILNIQGLLLKKKTLNLRWIQIFITV